ncbi:beta-ketoacyl synthase chain length factor [Photobacterium aphoticum]|uniref:3-oxoacyl-ACP synthase n=1 Tax=Photobacterium aphoticum TaxID=754436 RepID=A0A0J1GQL4_9GAMM|nr:beta-ketoacyl synthase chain length factor [Photobacterium aphoticum]KLV01694.1 3-oxoacyl-ACP synthase [Photobacterium aphoticum]PSU59270.1 3-oxoacyl-ACP synthase [Photobacterium aphoticum]
MNTVHFDIADWHALSPGLNTPQEWALWAVNNKTWPADPAPADFSAIPAMMRRRMSHLSKLAVQTAMTLMHDQSVDFIVFSSRHGELHRTVTLLQDVLRGDDASPIAFSQSVHNTAAGLFTIATKQAIPVTSIAAGEQSLHAALIEAAAYLAENPTHRVLVVDFDEPLPAPYGVFDGLLHQGFALGMILTHGNHIALRWQSSIQPSTQSADNAHDAGLPQTLSVISQLAQDKTAWSIAGRRQIWHWAR